MPRLPYDAVDILLIDEIGKNISGSRLDVNVVARKDRYHQPAPDTNPRIKMIAIRDLVSADSRQQRWNRVGRILSVARH